MDSNWAIVVGGGLSGLSAAHTILQAGGKVVLVDKCAFMGGNSTKATSGINGAGTRTQKAMGVPDSKEQFEEDTVRGATGVKTGPCPPTYELATVLSHQSADGVHWLMDSFDLVLDTVSRLGGHSFPRTHRRKSGGKFPGFMITYALMQKFEEICSKSPNRARFINKVRVNKLLTDLNGKVVGVEYKSLKTGATGSELGPVVLATGGYAAGSLEKGSFLESVRPDLMHNPTTNGEHCTGDGIVVAQAIGAKGVDLKEVQVHPTGLINPAMPDSKVLFLAAGALRGEGGIILDKDGNRFCNDLGTRDYVSGRMIEHNNGPYRLVLNSKATSGIAWHCHHYGGRGVMKVFKTGSDLAAEMGIPVSNLDKTFKAYNESARTKKDPWNKKYYPATPFDVNDTFNVAIVRPVNHYSMGGVGINGKGQVLHKNDHTIPGLFAAGEVTGGVHGKNRLGGSALLECVVFGRQAGASCVEYLKTLPAASGAGSTVTITIPQANGTSITVSITGHGVSTSGVSAPAHAAAAAAPATDAPAAAAQGEYTLEEVKKHNKEDDCWVVVENQVLDVTNFLSDHPGGKMAIMTFAGKDATEMFNMVHEDDVIEKFAPECVIGTLKASSKL